jgi:hypothetical protein
MPRELASQRPGDIQFMLFYITSDAKGLLKYGSRLYNDRSNTDGNSCFCWLDQPIQVLHPTTTLLHRNSLSHDFRELPEERKERDLLQVGANL